MVLSRWLCRPGSSGFRTLAAPGCHCGQNVRFRAGRVRPDSERQRPEFERANGRVGGKTSLKNK